MNDLSGLRFGPVATDALHIAVDMQRLFAEPGEWYTPALNTIVPAVARIAAHNPERTVFTRFITPAAAHETTGAWRRYYERWRSVTLQHMDAALLGLVEPLRRFIPPAAVIDKTTHSAFESTAFVNLLDHRRPATLIFSGVETDVCVLASVLTAVDRGYRVIVAADAVASSSAPGHEATLAAVLPRFDQQVEAVATDVLLRHWSA